VQVIGTNEIRGLEPCRSTEIHHGHSSAKYITVTQDSSLNTRPSGVHFWIWWFIVPLTLGSSNPSESLAFKASSSCKNLEKFHTFPLVFYQLRWNTFASPLPPNQCCMDVEMSIKVTRNNIERGRAWGEQTRLWILSDFPGECLNNFANSCC